MPAESKRMCELTLADEMVARAAQSLDRAYDRHEKTLEAVARDALEAAFEGVPIGNYSIGTLLQFFDLIICVKDTGALSVNAGVYVATGPDEFDALGHKLNAIRGADGQIKSVTISGLER